MTALDVDSKLVVWGASGHALVVADIIRLQGNYDIFGFLDDVNPDRHNTEFCSSFIIGGREKLDVLSQTGIRHLIVGIGDCTVRLRLSDIACGKGFSIATAVHPKAILASDVLIGEGTVIVAGTVINSGSRIGKNVIINTCASVDHECDIDDGAHICPGVHLAGRVKIGRATWIGIGATVIDRVQIGAGTTIGAGAVVVNDIPDGVIAYGVPAKVIRKTSSHDF